MRPEFDRYARFKSHGSAREIFDWEQLCDVDLPIPSLAEQQKVVDSFKAIDDRISALQQLNDKLEAQAQFQFDTLFDVESLAHQGETLGEIAEINPIRPLSRNAVAMSYDMSTLPTTGCTPVGGERKPYNGGMRFKNGDTILARITPCLENGKAAYINFLEDSEIAFGSTEYIVLSPKEGLPSEFLYFLARNARFVSFAVQHMNGSSGRQRVSGSDIATYPLATPNNRDLLSFTNLARPVVKLMLLNATEMMKLEKLKSQMLAKLSSR